MAALVVIGLAVAGRGASPARPRSFPLRRKGLVHLPRNSLRAPPFPDGPSSSSCGYRPAQQLLQAPPVVALRSKVPIAATK